MKQQTFTLRSFLQLSKSIIFVLFDWCARWISILHWNLNSENRIMWRTNLWGQGKSDQENFYSLIFSLLMMIIIIVIVVASLFNARIDYVFIFVNDDTIAFDTYSIEMLLRKFILLHSVYYLFVFDSTKEKNYHCNHEIIRFGFSHMFGWLICDILSNFGLKFIGMISHYIK